MHDANLKIENELSDNELSVFSDVENGINHKFIAHTNASCKIPLLSYDTNVRILPKIQCRQKENVGSIQDQIWHVSEHAKAKYPSLQCTYRAIYRISDFRIRSGEYRPLLDGQQIEDNVVEVLCEQEMPMFRFSTVFAQIISMSNGQINENLHKPDENKCTPLNVIVMSYDSVSRVSWINILQKTHKFATETMHFDILNGYNIVGDGTPAGKYPKISS